MTEIQGLHIMIDTVSSATAEQIRLVVIVIVAAILIIWTFRALTKGD